MVSTYKRILRYITDIKIWYVAASVILVGGIINYTLSYKAVSAAALFASSPLEQSLLETVMLVLVVTLGLISILLMTKVSSATNMRLAHAYFIIGVSLFVIWSVLVYEIWNVGK